MQAECTQNDDQLQKVTHKLCSSRLVRTALRLAAATGCMASTSSVSSPITPRLLLGHSPVMIRDLCLQVLELTLPHLQGDIKSLAVCATLSTHFQQQVTYTAQQFLRDIVGTCLRGFSTTDGWQPLAWLLQTAGPARINTPQADRVLVQLVAGVPLARPWEVPIRLEGGKAVMAKLCRVLDDAGELQATGMPLCQTIYKPHRKAQQGVSLYSQTWQPATRACSMHKSTTS